jgi:4-hydroxythreonine-4-phosphate dehydrogenase
MSTSRADRPRIAITSGEPAGIGPELCAQLAAHGDFGADLCILGDRELLQSRARAIGLRCDASIDHHALRVPSLPGRLDVANAPYVISLLDAALAGIAAGRYDAMVTAPVHKGVIAESGLPFTGHTEYLAERLHAGRPVMLLVADRLRVALATTHLPLRRVADALSQDGLRTVLDILHADLRQKFGIATPRIAVLGLNPHAGENGHLGDEEIRIIAPAIAAARAAGIDAAGPLPADTAFVPRELAHYDAVLAMYHDQGLPTIKHAGFGAAVNVTLGLPILRTSVDHGTALDLAGTGRADSGSLAAAVKLAVDLVRRRAG